MHDTASINADRAGTHERLRDAFIGLAATLEPQIRQDLLDQIAVVCITLSRGARDAGYLPRAAAYRRIAREALAADPLSVDARTSARLLACLGLVDVSQADLAVRAVLESPQEG